MPAEQVSALLMLLIVISASIIIYGYAVNVIQSRTQELNSLVMREQYEQSQSLSTLFAYLNGTHLVIAVATGQMPVQVYRVYINDTLQGSCSITYDGVTKTITAEGYVTIPGYTAALITCPTTASYAAYKITYGGGALVGEATRIT
jgi:archaellum component FlaG (FlaF/FlaG flagellin family)